MLVKNSLRGEFSQSSIYISMLFTDVEFQSFLGDKARVTKITPIMTCCFVLYHIRFSCSFVFTIITLEHSLTHMVRALGMLLVSRRPRFNFPLVIIGLNYDYNCPC